MEKHISTIPTANSIMSNSASLTPEKVDVQSTAHHQGGLAPFTEMAERTDCTTNAKNTKYSNGKCNCVTLRAIREGIRQDCSIGTGSMVTNLKQLHKLRSTLASYIGHFSHAHSQTLLLRLLQEFPWLFLLFHWNIQPMGIRPLYENTSLRYYRLQCDFFKAMYPNAVLSVQCGKNYCHISPDGIKRHQCVPFKAEVSEWHGIQHWLGERAMYYRSMVSKAIIRQVGLSRHGIQRRAVHELHFSAAVFH